MGLGHLTLDDIADRVPASRVFAPDRGTRAVYDRLHREFVRLARDQKVMYKRLNGRAGHRS